MPKVYVVNRPTKNKFGWTPDLSDASRFMKNFSEEDYILWPGGGDPIAVMVVVAIANEMSPIVRVLRWERNMEEGERDRRKGWYMPVSLEIRKVESENRSA